MKNTHATVLACVQNRGLEVTSQLLADNVLSTFWTGPLTHIGMKIITSKSETMVLSWKRVGCSLRLWGETLPMWKEFKYLRILIMSDGTWDCQMDHVSCSSVTVGILVHVVKSELSLQTINQCPCPHLWSQAGGSDETKRSWVQAVEIRFPWRVSGLTLCYRAREAWQRSSSPYNLKVQPLLLWIERSQ